MGAPNYTWMGYPFRKTVEATLWVNSLQYVWMGYPFYTNCLGEPTPPGGGNAVLVKVGGTFKTASATLIKVDGAWKTVSGGKIKISGAWCDL